MFDRTAPLRQSGAGWGRAHRPGLCAGVRPAGYKENACFKADAATAAYWYQAVLDKDKDNAQALARLKDLPK